MRAARRTRRTTSNDVGPIGLSITSTASIGGAASRGPTLFVAAVVVIIMGFARLGRRITRRRVSLLAQDLLDALGLLEHLVYLELHGGRDLHPQAARDRLAKVSARVIQPLPHALQRRAVRVVH